MYNKYQYMQWDKCIVNHTFIYYCVIFERIINEPYHPILTVWEYPHCPKSAHNVLVQLPLFAIVEVESDKAENVLVLDSQIELIKNNLGFLIFFSLPVAK